MCLITRYIIRIEVFDNFIINGEVIAAISFQGVPDPFRSSTTEIMEKRLKVGDTVLFDTELNKIDKNLSL